MHKMQGLAGLLLVSLLNGHALFAGTSQYAAVASAHPLATAAGLEIIEEGGNAFDAAIAVAAVLAVVEPYSAGLGGGGFWLLHRASDGRQVMLDSRERAPLAAHPTLYLDALGEVRPNASINGPLAAGIPGVPAAMAHLAQHYGRLPLARSLASAIHHAQEGFPVDQVYRRLAKFRHQALLDSPEAARLFLRNGQIPELGTALPQADLAATLRALAKDGAAGFYQGQVGQRLLQGVRAGGGIWTQADLDRYTVKERTPLTGSYRGIKIISAAPPSSGGVALLTMLHILEARRYHQQNPATRKHLLIEAMRRAYRDRAEYLGDPDQVTMPIARLIHPYYGAGLGMSIRLDRATPSAELPAVAVSKEGPNTTHFSILDGQGNRVAATLSINYPFGAGFVAPGTGVLLNDEMDDFSKRPNTPNAYGLVGGQANAIAPGKRMLSSMSPTFLEDKQGIAIVGTPGGSRIISMLLLAILDYAEGHGPESWVNLPRLHHQYLPDTVQYEAGALSEKELAHLRGLGHRLKELSQRYGNMQAIYWHRQTGQVSAASDPRRIGQARTLRLN